MSLRSLVHLAFTVVVCAALLATPALAQGSPPESATLSSIWTQVEQIRHLNRLTQPDVAMLDHTALENRIADEFQRDYLPSERQRDDKLYSALGMIQPSDDLAQLELHVELPAAGAAIAGSSSRMVVGGRWC
jgi:hypothetical protein